VWYFGEFWGPVAELLFIYQSSDLHCLSRHSFLKICFFYFIFLEIHLNLDRVNEGSGDFVPFDEAFNLTDIVQMCAKNVMKGEHTCCI
jgi:hypothetical protein